MKTLLAFMLIVSGCAYAKNKKEIKFTHLQCKQKILPINVNYSHDPGSLTVVLKAESEITDFKVSAIRGIDGLEVRSSKLQGRTNLNRDESVEVSAEILEPSGLSYVVLDLEGKVRGAVKKQTIAVPVGEQAVKVQEVQKTSTQPVQKRKVMKIE